MDEETNALLNQYRAGDHTVLEQLFSIYRSRLKQMIHVRLHPRVRPRVDESDILQDTLLHASQQLSSYLQKPEMSFFVWLRWLTSQQIQLCHRFHLDAAKRDARKDERARQGESAPSLSAIVANQVAQTTPSKIVAKEEIASVVMQVLDEMKPKDREILTMRYFESLDNAEVAETLGITESNASTRYVRALARLQKELDKIPGIRNSY